MNGKISYIADVPLNDNIFVSRVAFTSMLFDIKKPAKLKQGMLADVKIITEDATLLQRLTRNVLKAMHRN